MKERILVKNFGPIRDVIIEVRDINIFIGTTSSGKSTIAKLLAIFQSEHIRFKANWNRESSDDASTTLLEFNRLLVNYNIDFGISKDTVIRYELEQLYCEVRAGFFESTFSPYNTVPYINPVYIPAERVFYSTLSQSIFSLINNDVSIPKWLLDFGNKFEKARRDISYLNIGFLNTSYSFKDGNDLVQLENGNSIQLSQASSGVQSTIPLMLVLQSLTENVNDVKKESGNDFFVIEEPEMNLYPSSQKELLQFIIERINRCSDKLVITTHSPYILTSLDNLVQAENAARNEKNSDKVDKVIPQKLWTNFDKVSCYFFDKGSAKCTLDNELRSLGPSSIDNVSEELSEIFDTLLTLKYTNE